MSDARGHAEKGMENFLKFVTARWMKQHLPRVNLCLANCLSGEQVVENAFRKAKQKANLPRQAILSVSGKTLGYVCGNVTLLESLNDGVAWNDGVEPPKHFNLYRRTSGGDYYILPYNVPISELPKEVFLMVVDTEIESKKYMIESYDYSSNNEVPDHFREDKDVALAAVNQNGRILLSWHQFQGDQDVVKAAVKAGANQKRWICPKHHFNKFSNPSILINLYKDEEFVLELVKRDGRLLRILPRRFCSNKEIVRAAVTEGQGNCALQYASFWLRGNLKTVLMAVEKRGRALKHALLHLRGNLKVVRSAVQNDGIALEHALLHLRGYLEVVRSAVQNNGLALKFALPHLRGNPEVVLAAVKQNGKALKFASQKLKADRGIVLAAVTKNGDAIKYASAELQKDPEILRASQR